MKNNVVDTIRLGGDVERFHTIKMLARQNVAQHSYNAALMGYVIAYEAFMNDNSLEIEPENVCLHMLVHDISEQATGDMPSFSKRDYPPLKIVLDMAEHDWAKKNLPTSLYIAYNKDNLTTEEKVICKYVDQYECLMTCMQEIALGNKSFILIADRCIRAMMDTMEQVNNTPSLYGVLFNYTTEAIKTREECNHI